ncbi:hypothetical protein J3F83DRAFT_527850 [Trichoderma novae-zelandiae]
MVFPEFRSRRNKSLPRTKVPSSVRLLVQPVLPPPGTQRHFRHISSSTGSQWHSTSTAATEYSCYGTTTGKTSVSAPRAPAHGRMTEGVAVQVLVSHRGRDTGAQATEHDLEPCVRSTTTRRVNEEASMGESVLCTLYESSHTCYRFSVPSHRVCEHYYSYVSRCYSSRSRWAMVLHSQGHLASNLGPPSRQSSYCDAKELRPDAGARSLVITQTLNAPWSLGLFVCSLSCKWLQLRASSPTSGDIHMYPSACLLRPAIRAALANGLR